MDQLVASLLDLLRELDGRGLPLTVGGGFGLYLKRTHLTRTGQQTLFTQLPEVRSTNDIDMFLRAEVLADLSRTKEVADAIKRLGYQVVEEAKYLQWKRPVAVGGIARAGAQVCNADYGDHAKAPVKQKGRSGRGLSGFYSDHAGLTIHSSVASHGVTAGHKGRPSS